MSKNPENQSSTIAKGLMVLDLFSKEENLKGLSLTDVSKKLNINQSTSYRYLTTLCEYGWIEKDETSYIYRLGNKALQLAGAYLSQMDLRSVAHIHLQKLVEETNQTAHVGILSGDQILYIDKVESNSPLQMRSYPGMVAPLYCTAMGKAILATMPVSYIQNELHDKLQKRTSKTLTNVDDLLKNLEMISDLGYSVDNEENEEGISCIGSAIFGYDNKVLGAISISTLTKNLEGEGLKDYSIKVRMAASSISKSMGCITDHWKLNIGKFITR